MDFLKKIAVPQKVFGGFAVVLLLLLVVAAIGVVSLRSADDNFSRYRQISLQSLQAGRVQANLLEARVATYQYMTNGSADAIARGKDRLEGTDKYNEQLLSLLIRPDRVAVGNRNDDLIEQYKEAFRDLVAAQSQAERDQIFKQKLEPLGPKLAEDLEKLKLDIKAEQDELGPRADKAIGEAVISMIIVAVIALLVGGLAAWIIGTGISKPISQITHAMRDLAGGNKTIRIPGQERGDEIGEMSKAVLVFQENMIKADEMAEYEKEQVRLRQARADLIERLTKEFDQDVADVLNGFASAATEMQVTAQSMTATAEQTSRQSTAVAAAADEASTNVQTVASATEQLSSSIDEISGRVSHSAQIASKATEDATRTNAQVEGLAEAALRIGEVVNLINDIANQTNLLALNATIEAARAGEAGKGFAVVAAEVKNLASATARATDEITSQISAIQNETRSAVSAIQGIGTTISELNEIAASIASAVEQQGAATGEITRNIQQASQGTNDVSHNIYGVTEAASSTGAAAQQVLSASGELSQQSEVLRGRVDQFLEAVRTA
ncbi:methyl-accepting chemotaxis protein [Thalassospira sp. TSL5-1]|uniref:methyl-accepting chemotaxis protein n=1 Tax=Thalassospira sp. TSL5-1 TaxID=1544451 RepID=UPI00093E73D9|nr:methyl-accepting chemotaxis protein [Thalassospira sp. TSL5-1]OKH87026.1 chemotaxis protein [Thalassospira sp. TSL5-1]